MKKRLKENIFIGLLYRLQYDRQVEITHIKANKRDKDYEDKLRKSLYVHAAEGWIPWYKEHRVDGDVVIELWRKKPLTLYTILSKKKHKNPIFKQIENL